jgi:hypothetical protein
MVEPAASFVAHVDGRARTMIKTKWPGNVDFDPTQRGGLRRPRVAEHNVFMRSGTRC